MAEAGQGACVLTDELRGRIKREVACLKESAVASLQECVRIRSVCGDEAEEERMVQAMLSVMREHGGCDHVEAVQVSGDDIAALPHTSPPIGGQHRTLRSVLGVKRAAGAREGWAERSVVFNGHMDVVPVEDESTWSHSVWEGEVDGDRLYGRGCGDMKAGLLSAVFALAALRRAGVRLLQDVQLHAVLDEECSGNGAASLLSHIERAHPTLARNVSACLIPEPFAFLMTAQLGVMWCDITVHGTPVHVLDTGGGCNAIEIATGSVWHAMKALEAQWNEPAATAASHYARHPHPINFNLGQVQGGCWRSSVPERCVMRVRVGFLPRCPLADVRRAIEETVLAAAAAANVKATVSYEGFAADGVECVPPTVSSQETLLDTSTSPLQLVSEEEEHVDVRSVALFRALSHSHELVHGRPAAIAPVTCTTDARFYRLYRGIPTTCFGPEYTRNIHGIDESVSISSYLSVIELFACFLVEWCGAEVSPEAARGTETEGKGNN
eukprot:TRINITY_DN15981_c0_g1_i1.p1 TRINITY_DN15981_c0_g1~~TRINITY_DN15981_c0_g1_i1.p1  ORF type:complete len:528 (+),score=149.50 TRINITY_DN15981_c0_g1_i1:95-1585(+)